MFTIKDHPMRIVISCLLALVFAFGNMTAQNNAPLASAEFPFFTLRIQLMRTDAQPLMQQRYNILLPTTVGPFFLVGAASLSAQPLLWPSLQSNVVRLLRWPTFYCSPLLSPAGPRDELWQAQPDGGIVRMVGSNLEYEAPPIRF